MPPRCTDAATAAACLRPGPSRSAITTTSAAPRRLAVYSSRHLPAPPTLHVAAAPVTARLSASFSPSTTNTVPPACAAAMTSGSRYRTRLMPFTPGEPSGRYCRNVLRCPSGPGSRRRTVNRTWPCSSVYGYSATVWGRSGLSSGLSNRSAMVRPSALTTSSLVHPAWQWSSTPSCPRVTDREGALSSCAGHCHDDPRPRLPCVCKPFSTASSALTPSPPTRTSSRWPGPPAHRSSARDAGVAAGAVCR